MHCAVAQAQPARFAIEYELSAADCPAPARFVAGVEARLAQPLPASTPARLSVRVTAQAGGVRGELAVRSGTTLIERRIDAASCTEAIDALALVAALLFSPSLEAPPSKAPAQRQRDRRDEGARAAQAEVVSPLSSTPDESAAQSPAEVPPSAPAPAQTHAPVAAAGVENATAPASGTAELPVPVSSAMSLRASLALGLLLVTGVAPEPRPGAELSVLFAWQRARFELGAELGLRGAWPYHSEREAGAVRFAFWAGAARLCSLGLFAQGRVGISGCLASELGKLYARGSDTLEARSAQRLWAALGPAARVELRWGARYWLRAGPELLFPLSRHRYTLADNTVFSVPRVTIRLELAFGLQFL